jgi:hypothetical protein
MLQVFAIYSVVIKKRRGSFFERYPVLEPVAFCFSGIPVEHLLCIYNMWLIHKNDELTRGFGEAVRAKAIGLIPVVHESEVSDYQFPQKLPENHSTTIKGVFADVRHGSVERKVAGDSKI